ncbi:MAG: heme ABC transporter ATP-binding protein [Proteobacteria bacterium]|nr:MAG: heme ABC transporter ATP-binding protein [Pseudomonadota bacterium]
MTAVVEVAGATVRVGAATLLDGVALTVHGGETVAIVGPNGAGKSTLARLMSGDLAPTSGDVRFKGRALSAYRPRDLARHRAVLSQHIAVNFAFTVDEIVRMGAGEARGAAVEALIATALAETGLTAFRRRELPTMSGGEQQRAHFARVLVQLACGEAAHGPGLLLLDEPTSSLDLRHQLDLVDSAKRRAVHGTAVVAILHDLNLAARFADRVVVLHRGRGVADGPVRDVITATTLREVFDIDTRVEITSDNLPAILPQAMQVARDT